MITFKERCYTEIFIWCTGVHVFFYFLANKRDMKKKPIVYNQNNNNNNLNVTVPAKSDEPELDTSGFASETTEQEQESLQNYKLATANLVMPSDIVIGMVDSEGSPKSSSHSGE